jgi:hypothetical protein
VVVVLPCGRLERDDVEGVVDSQYVQVCSVEWLKSRRRDSVGLSLTFIVERRAWQDPVTCQSHHAEASQLLKKGSAPSTIGKSDNSDNSALI